jgi:hypothetical protein
MRFAYSCAGFLFVALGAAGDLGWVTDAVRAVYPEIMKTVPLFGMCERTSNSLVR